MCVKNAGNVDKVEKLNLKNSILTRRRLYGKINKEKKRQKGEMFMKETYADYIVVNVSNYTIKNTEEMLALSVSELKCLPRNFEKSLYVGSDDTIEKYLFSPILPYKLNSEKFMGAGVLCKLDESGNMDVCADAGADTNFYVRCLNLAQLIDLYKGQMKFDKDRQIINHLAKVLSNMLTNRIMKLYSKTNNLALCHHAQKTLVNLDKRVMALDDLENLVLGLEEYEINFIKNNFVKRDREL